MSVPGLCGHLAAQAAFTSALAWHGFPWRRTAGLVGV